MKKKMGEGIRAFYKLHNLIKKSGAKPYEAYIEMKYGADSINSRAFKDKLIADMKAFSKSMIKRRKLVRCGGFLDYEYVGMIKATDHWIDYLNDWFRTEEEEEKIYANVHKGRRKKENRGTKERCNTRV